MLQFSRRKNFLLLKLSVRLAIFLRQQYDQKLNPLYECNL